MQIIPNFFAFFCIFCGQERTEADSTSFGCLYCIAVKFKTATIMTLKNKLTPEQWYKIIETMVLALLTCCAVGLGMTSCKVWRTVNTTATYTTAQDSAKTATTIQMKTVEEYHGAKKK